MKYRLSVGGVSHLLCAKELYKQHVKGHRQTINNVPYMSKSIVVELNLTNPMPTKGTNFTIPRRKKASICYDIHTRMFAYTF